jgi:hypothetical protein
VVNEVNPMAQVYLSDIALALLLPGQRPQCVTEMAKNAGLALRPFCVSDLIRRVADALPTRDCLTYHYDGQRTGTGDGVPTGATWIKYNSVSLKSPVRGAPLFLRGWGFTNGKLAGQTQNVVIVATSDNHVYAFAEDHLRAGSSSYLWRTPLGTPLRTIHPSPEPNFGQGATTQSNLDPPPVGVSSTPVIDQAGRRMFTLACQDDGAGWGMYVMYVLDLDTGEIVGSATLTDTGRPGRPKFDGKLVDQRGALNLVNGRIIATFACLWVDDHGPYHGWVVSINANNLSDLTYFSSTTNVFGGGIWAPGGVSVAPDETIYVGAGNGTTADDPYWAKIPPGKHPADLGDYFIAVVKLDAQLNVLDWYQPGPPLDVRKQNDSDKDFGSSSLLILPDGIGRPMAVFSPKAGIYLLDRMHLGHFGNELWKAEGVFPSESHSAPAYYQTPSGEHYLYFIGDGRKTNADKTKSVSAPDLRCYKVVFPGLGASLESVWSTPPGSPTLSVYGGSPTVGSISGESPYSLVWVVGLSDSDNEGTLYAFDALTGAPVYNSSSRPSDRLGEAAHYAPVTCAGQSVFVGTLDGLACLTKLACNAD